MMAQAQLSGGTTPRSQLEEDALLGYDQDHPATAPPQDDLEAAEEEMDVVDTESTSTVNTAMLGGLANVTLAGEGSTQVPPAGQQELQHHEGIALPLTMRNGENTAALLQKWINLDYMCPYPQCGFVPPGCRRDGKVMRPDRWSDFTDHWFCHHMVPTLLLVCKKEGCGRKGKVYHSCKQFSAHLKTHHDINTDVAVVQLPLQEALATFTAAVGPEAAYTDIKSKVVFPSHHLSWRQMRTTLTTTTTTTSTATVAASTSAATTTSSSAAAAITSSDSSSRRSRHDATSGYKREASSSSSRASKRPKQEGGERLTMPRLARELPKSASIEVSAALSSVRDNFNVKVGETLTSATSAMIKAGYKCETVCKQVDLVREACNEYLDSLDTQCYTFATWQKQLGNKPPPVAPPKRLVSAAIVDDVRRLTVCQQQLSKALADNSDLKKRLAASEAQVQRLSTGISLPAPTTAATTPRNTTVSRSIAGSSRVVNRPGTTVAEIDLLSEQLSACWRFVQEHR